MHQFIKITFLLAVFPFRLKDCEAMVINNTRNRGYNKNTVGHGLILDGGTHFLIFELTRFVVKSVTLEHKSETYGLQKISVSKITCATLLPTP